MGYQFTVSVSEDRVTEHHSLRRGTLPRSAEGSLADRNRFILASDKSYKELFNEFFAPYIQAYNDKQKRKDRRWDMDYWQKLVDGGQVEPINSFVIQLGNRDTTAAITDVSFDVKVWRELRDTDPTKAAEYVRQHLNTHPNVDKTADVLEEVARRFATWYPNFVPVSLVIHADEPDGTPHLDANGFWVARKNKRGLDVRCAKQEALKQMGFDGSAFGSPYMDWQADVQRRVTDVMEEMYGFERELVNSHEPHVSIPTYRIQQERREAAEKTRELQRKAEVTRENLARYEDEIRIVKRRKDDIEEETRQAEERLRETEERRHKVEAEARALEQEAADAQARARAARVDEQTARKRAQNAQAEAERVERETEKARRILDQIADEVEKKRRQICELIDGIDYLTDIETAVGVHFDYTMSWLKRLADDKDTPLQLSMNCRRAVNALEGLRDDYIDGAAGYLANLFANAGKVVKGFVEPQKEKSWLEKAAEAVVQGFNR